MDEDEIKKEETLSEALVRLWNEFVMSVFIAQTSWEELTERITEGNPTIEELQALPIEVQKGLNIFKRQKFSVMMPRFVDYCRTRGGVEELLAK